MFHIIDDADFVREVVADILNEHGYEAKTFSCPKAYIRFVNSSGFSDPVAVLTDVTMPIMSGYEMIDIVSRLKQGLKFVIMTGEPGIRSDHVNKACMYLVKPFTPASLINVIASLIQCQTFSPDDDHGCTDVDGRDLFPIKAWSCPHRSPNCSTDCA